MRKKTVAAFMIAAMIFFTATCALAADKVIEAWDGESVSEAWGSDYDSNDSFIINDASEFIKFRNMVLDGKSFSQKNVFLESDIDLNNFNLKYGIGRQINPGSGPWKDGESEIYFKGNFIGKGHIVKNLKMDQTQDDAVWADNSYENYSVALFTLRSGSVKNLGIENVNIVLPAVAPAWQSYYGGLAGINNAAIISGCYIKNIAFSGGWNATSRNAYIAGLVSYHMFTGVSDCYTDGVDFSAISSNAAFIRSTYKAGIALAERDNTKISHCYSTNIKNIADETGQFDSVVWITNGNVSVTNTYTDTPLRISGGKVQGDNHASGTIEEACADVAGNFGSGFIDLTSRGCLPVLVWEYVPPLYGYDSIDIYSDYGTAEEKKIEKITAEDGNLTAVIYGLANNTGFDLDGVQINFSFISGRQIAAQKSLSVNIPKLTKMEEAIIIPLSYSPIQLKEGDFAQVIGYKNIDSVIPIFNVKRIEK